MVNKVILVGNLGKDPELRFTPNGQAVAKFPVATTEKWRDQQGQMQERTEWHNIVVWGKQAESCGQYLSDETIIRIAAKLYEARDAARRVYGRRWPAVCSDWQRVIRACMEDRHLAPLDAAILLCDSNHADHSVVTEIIAAAVEMSEAEDLNRA